MLCNQKEIVQCYRKCN